MFARQVVHFLGHDEVSNDGRDCLVCDCLMCDYLKCDCLMCAARQVVHCLGRVQVSDNGRLLALLINIVTILCVQYMHVTVLCEPCLPYVCHT